MTDPPQNPAKHEWDRDKWGSWQQYSDALKDARLNPRERVLLELLWSAYEGPLSLPGVLGCARIAEPDSIEARMRLAQSVIAELRDREWIELFWQSWVSPSTREPMDPLEVDAALDDSEMWVWPGTRGDDKSVFLEPTDQGMDAYRILETKVWGDRT